MNSSLLNTTPFGAELLNGDLLPRRNGAAPNGTSPIHQTQPNGTDPNTHVPATTASAEPSGVAPWERTGTHPPPAPPSDPISRAKAAKYENHIVNNGLRQREREERRRLKEEMKKKIAEEKEKKRIEDLEMTAKKMFWLGVVGLPIMFLVMLSYFWKEYREPNKHEVIKKCKLLLLFMEMCESTLSERCID